MRVWIRFESLGAWGIKGLSRNPLPLTIRGVFNTSGWGGLMLRGGDY